MIPLRKTMFWCLLALVLVVGCQTQGTDETGPNQEQAKREDPGFEPEDDKLTETTQEGFDAEEFIMPSEEELKERLTNEQFKITQREGTERPYLNEFWLEFDENSGKRKLDILATFWHSVINLISIFFQIWMNRICKNPIIHPKS